MKVVLIEILLLNSRRNEECNNDRAIFEIIFLLEFQFQHLCKHITEFHETHYGNKQTKTKNARAN